MDHGACNVIYLDRRARQELGKKGSTALGSHSQDATEKEVPDYFVDGSAGRDEVDNNINHILATFGEVTVCRSGSSCLSKLSELNDDAANKAATIVLIDIPHDEEKRLRRLSREPRTPSPTSVRRTTTDLGAADLDDLYGIHLLVHIASEIQSQVLSRLVVPVVVLSGFEQTAANSGLSPAFLQGAHVVADPVRTVRYLDAGATDVLTSPLSKDQVHSLTVHAYRVHKEVMREETSFLASKRNRKVSWVGVDEKRPYAYLREAMVSNLMSGICTPEVVGEQLNPTDVVLSPERKAAVAKAVGLWSFNAHSFSDDELLHAALTMLQHALNMSELAGWRMSTEELTIFLLASRTAYNDFVLYHNFRHVVDVLQAMFYFLVQIGTLPPYPAGSQANSSSNSAIGSLLKPFDALTLLIAAIGHDVGHPGVNNAFLVALNAPLAQLYNDRSVLESFHCAAYSQILRRYWPVAFADIAMRKLMINSILATDMGVHFKYMADLGNLQERFSHNKRTLDGWNLKQLEEYKDLTCGLLIKCADISNVARKFDVASDWAMILTDEFSNQGIMEKELNIPTCLFGGPPIRDNIIKMGESQIGFMNIFARPLFEAVTDILPAMRFSVDEILLNQSIWEGKMSVEKEKRASSKSIGKNAPVLRGGGAEGGLHPPGGSQTDLREAPSGSPLGSSEPTISRSSVNQACALDETSQSTRSSCDSPAHATAASSSRRSSLGPATSTDITSRRSSNGVITQGGGAFCRRGTQDSAHEPPRPSSTDASLTTILVTQQGPNGTAAATAPLPDSRKQDSMAQRLRSLSPVKRKGCSSPAETKKKNSTGSHSSTHHNHNNNNTNTNSATYPAPPDSAHTLSEPVMQAPAGNQRYPSSTQSNPDFMAYPVTYPASDTLRSSSLDDSNEGRPHTSSPEKSKYLTSVMGGNGGSHHHHHLHGNGNGNGVEHGTMRSSSNNNNNKTGGRFTLSRLWKKLRSEGKTADEGVVATAAAASAGSMG